MSEARHITPGPWLADAVVEPADSPMPVVEPAQQALEALVQIHPGNMTPMAEKAWNKAIAALRTALAEQAPPAAGPAQEPLFLLHTGTIYGNERGDWEVETNSGWGVDVDIYCDANPGRTVGLYLAPPAAVPAGYALVPVEPTEAMLNAARDWSLKKYGQAVGNDGARGCYAAMLAAANKE